MPGIVTFDDVAFVNDLRNFSEAKRDALQTAIRRSTYAALNVSFRLYSQIMEQQDYPWFKRRRGAIMKRLRKSGRRVRVRPADAQTLRARLNLTHIAAGPLEFGGAYEQWVTEHRRFQKTVFGQELEKARWIRVAGFRRLRWEHAHGWLGTAMEATEDVYERITGYSLNQIAAGNPPPSRDELMGMVA